MFNLFTSSAHNVLNLVVLILINLKLVMDNVQKQDGR